MKELTTAGTFRLQHKLLYIANALVDQHIGLDETDDRMDTAVREYAHELQPHISEDARPMDRGHHHEHERRGDQR